KSDDFDAEAWCCSICENSDALDLSVVTVTSGDAESDAKLQKENEVLKLQIITLNKLVSGLEKVNKLQEEKIKNLENKNKNVPIETTNKQSNNSDLNKQVSPTYRE
ncbi:hypothetical protein CBL_21118, partial [Carabus blaptoides fortunei]